MRLITTRFAPSPTGALHLGHAAAACFAADAAAGGCFLLRIEDLDRDRCRETFVTAIFDDLSWLGLAWHPNVRPQSQHFADYQAALSKLSRLGLLYPCFCSRADIAREIAASSTAPHGPGGPLYPGLCRRLDADRRRQRELEGSPFCLRLDMAASLRLAGPLEWRDVEQGPQLARPELWGDVVLARKDMPACYHLAVTVDDALQGVTLVTRGADLFAASHLHRLLQALLGLPVPLWQHHPLLRGADGKRLSKRDGAQSLRQLRAQGLSSAEVRAMARLALA